MSHVLPLTRSRGSIFSQLLSSYTDRKLNNNFLRWFSVFPFYVVVPVGQCYPPPDKKSVFRTKYLLDDTEAGVDLENTKDFLGNPIATVAWLANQLS